VAALGDEGRATVPGAVAELQAAWGKGRAVEVQSLVVGEDRRLLGRSIRRWCDRERVDVVLTIGRSGHLAGDFAPEVTLPLLERTLPGVEERMYLAPPRRVEELLFRGRAGVRGVTVVVNLPARRARVAAIAAFLAPLLGHALEKMRGSDRECGGDPR
jgi:molybdopterin biosynthesis enzyme MoaB